MGKGDMKTKRGKIVRGSYGKLRPRNTKKKKTAPIWSRFWFT
jgi:ribosomal small subunit protein bTHX